MRFRNEEEKKGKMEEKGPVVRCKYNGGLMMLRECRGVSEERLS